MALFSAFALVGLLATPARADEAEVKACVRAKVQEAYGQGWSIRTSTTASLALGETDIYAISMQAGNHYRILACADAQVSDVGLFLYDADGKLLQSDPSQDREPVIELQPNVSGRFYVVVQAASMAGGGTKGAIATAVVFK